MSVQEETQETMLSTGLCGWKGGQAGPRSLTSAVPKKMSCSFSPGKVQMATLAHLDYTTSFQLSRSILVHLEKGGLLKTSFEKLEAFSWGKVMIHKGHRGQPL